MPPKLRLRGQEVEWQTRVRYLSVQIDRSMRMAAEVENFIHQIRVARSMLCSVLRSHLLFQTKVALYKGYIRSRIMYAAPAWYNSTSQRKNIQAQQNIALRMILRAGLQEFLQNIALMYERSSSSRPFPRELLQTPPLKG
ncbi:hypothetical protein EVAR_37858_1 [Eumeta japonica]|uniref:RNA-directed DNA polymerase from transposon X-element n=1 Tax=Eumeta variegata TaxID=151549 RepID=A0A4C1X484_EUMVA|nr:hypothetical protein EVAR_37858_1 [Eumeta japonica]